MEPVIRCDGVVKRFGTFTAVDSVDLALAPGEVFALLGPNGAGKTTTIRMLCGLLAHDAGTISINGQTAGRERFDSIGVCPQALVYWKLLTVAEQLRFTAAIHNVPSPLISPRITLLLEALGLSAKRDALAKDLSGGMQRRLNLLLALMHDPQILILDEPEAGLDPQSRVLVREYIRSLARTKTVLFTTHNMDEADRVSDRIAVIDHGKLLAAGSPAELKRQYGGGEVLTLRWNTWNEESRKNLAQLFSGACELDDAMHTLTIRGEKLIRDLSHTLEQATGAGGDIASVELREPSLEDVFLNLTGRSLRE